MHLEPRACEPGPVFSVVVPTWNNLELLKCCVDSVRRNSAVPHQLIVHVNDGSDGTLDWVRSQGIDHTHSPGNIGICLPVNQAAALAKHELILYLNDDMYCCPGWDEALMRRVRGIGHDAFMLSATMVEPVESGNRCVSVADFGRGPETFDEAGLLSSLARLRRGDWFGSTWPPTLVHRRWWHAVGGYSTELSPGMSSDNDFAMKMWHAGCRIFVGAGDSLVYHFMSRSTGKVVKNDGRRQFLWKWGMTQSVFDRHFLRRGESVKPGEDWVLRGPADTWHWRWDRTRATIKRKLSA